MFENTIKQRPVNKRITIQNKGINLRSDARRDIYKFYNQPYDICMRQVDEFLFFILLQEIKMPTKERIIYEQLKKTNIQ